MLSGLFQCSCRLHWQWNRIVNSSNSPTIVSHLELSGRALDKVVREPIPLPMLPRTPVVIHQSIYLSSLSNWYVLSAESLTTREMTASLLLGAPRHKIPSPLIRRLPKQTKKHQRSSKLLCSFHPLTGPCATATCDRVETPARRPTTTTSSSPTRPSSGTFTFNYGCSSARPLSSARCSAKRTN